MAITKYQESTQPVQIAASDEWSRLRAVIVGRAGKSAFPSEPPAMIHATMPPQHHHLFKPHSPFPTDIVLKAEHELNQFARILHEQGVRVYRPPEHIDWVAEGGYTGAMARDGLLVVENVVIESVFAWGCREKEVEVAYGGILGVLGREEGNVIVRRPEGTFGGSLLCPKEGEGKGKWAINNSRPALEAADFMRFGRTVLGQFSHVTNQAGVDYLRKNLPSGYTVEMVETNDPHAMHIDATILPLKRGLLVYNPQRVTEKALRRHEVLRDWDLVAMPFVPREHEYPPLYMTSAWLSLNVLVIGQGKVVVEEQDTPAIEFYESLGMTCLKCPFRHVYSLGGSFHCATVDLVRDGDA